MLTLTIKSQWFDMIASGEKLEEYRRICPYYDRLFKDRPDDDLLFVRFRNGYRSDSPLMECVVNVQVKEGYEAWGAELGVYYYALGIYNVTILIPRKSR